jgi:uncharacterized protein YndB with AHSA1/START domain
LTSHKIPEPAARTGMLIRRPVRDVFEAFVEPAVTTRFWFTASTGRLEPGAEVTWTWAMYGVSDRIKVHEFELDKRVEFDWSLDAEPTTVIWTFMALDENRTFVDIVNYGFEGTEAEKAAAALDSTGGFCLVLAGAKAWLEHGIQLNLVGDRFPPEMGEH